MRTLVIVLLVMAAVPALPTVDAYACVLDPEDPEQYVACEEQWAERCTSRLLTGGACPL